MLKQFPLLLSLALLSCETSFGDTRDLPEPPALPATTIPCPPRANIAADKMNVLYVGVDNPVSIDLDGGALNDLRVSCVGASISGDRGKYLVRPRQIGEVKILASLNGEPRQERVFRAKRIPDPIVKLGQSAGGEISVGEFKAQRGLVAFLDNFDFDARCMVAGFRIHHIPKGEVGNIVINQGARYSDAAIELVKRGKAGDYYAYTDVAVKCPGDEAPRRVNSLVFELR